MKKQTKINIILLGLLIIAFLVYYIKTQSIKEGALKHDAEKLRVWLDRAKDAMSAFTL
jgi:hypothetical protein